MQAPAGQHLPGENIYDLTMKAGFPGHREGRADSIPRRFQNIHGQGGHAPGRDLKFTHLTTNDGLSDNRINSILQDRRGFMWFATEDGLNRYDGNTFVVYKNNPDDPKTLSASLIQNLIEDGHGYLWIGTWGGLDKLDPTTERLTHYRYNPDNPNSISGDAIKSIAQDSRGHLWVGTVDDGLNKFDPATETFTRYRNDSDGQFVGEINSIIEDSHRDIWFAGPRGLFHLSPQTGQITRLPATIDRLAASADQQTEIRHQVGWEETALTPRKAHDEAFEPGEQKCVSEPCVLYTSAGALSETLVPDSICPRVEPREATIGLLSAAANCSVARMRALRTSPIEELRSSAQSCSE
jgi:hypothetical protein